jgi:hypothetical protein
MKWAIALGSYSLPAFIELQLRSLRKLFPGEPVIVVDDLSRESAQVRDIAAEFGVHHWVGETHRGHFAGDVQTLVAGLAFAEAEKADVLLKLSQRLVLCAPAAREVFERYFSDENIWMVMPARIHPGSIKRAESRFFANLAALTDVLAIRTGKLRPAELKTLYETRVKEAKNRFDSLVEPMFSFIEDVVLAGHVVRAPELSHTPPGRPRLYLRKAQCQAADYQIYGRELGMNIDGWAPQLQEWRALDGDLYRPVPCFQ